MISSVPDSADPLSLINPAENAIPVVFDSPHSGVDFPEDFQSSVDRRVLLQTADMFVDELYAAAPSRGAAFLCAHFPRVYIDANRPLSDLDPASVGESDKIVVPSGSAVSRGIGLIWTRAPDQSAIYDRPLSRALVDHRIDAYWRRYHDTLANLLSERRAAFGAVWHVNCHSMPGSGTKAMGDEGCPRADFIIGDRDGTTCAPDFSGTIVEFLRGKGFDVRVNELFRGAEIVRRYGKPDTGSHSVQIEMNRRLYMDEHGLTKLDGFGRFRDRVIDPLIETVCAYASRQTAKLSSR